MKDQNVALDVLHDLTEEASVIGQPAMKGI